MFFYRVKRLAVIAIVVLGAWFVFSVAAFTGPTLSPPSGGGLLYGSGSSIGLGTTTPAAYLSVYGSSRDALRLTTIDTVTRLSFFDSGTNVSYPNLGSSGNDLYLAAGGSERMRVTSAGYVGIASSSPGYPLSVHGNVFTDSSFIGSLSGALSAANVTGPTAFGSNINTGPPAGYVYAFPQALAIGTTTVTGLPTNGLVIANTTNNNNRILVFSGYASNTWDFYGGHGSGGYLGIAENQGTPFFTILASTGYVGVGTSTPSNLLTVAGTGSVYGAIQTNTDNQAALKLSTASYNWTIGIHGGGAGTFKISNYTSLGTNDYFVITTSSNVGIATTTPQGKLVIAGQYYSAEVDRGNSGSSITIDWSAGNTQHVILNANPVTFAFSNGQAGGRYTLILKQDSGGNKTVNWPSSVRFGSAGSPNLTTLGNATDYVGFEYNGVDQKYDNVSFTAGF